MQMESLRQRERRKRGDSNPKGQDKLQAVTADAVADLRQQTNYAAFATRHAPSGPILTFAFYYCSGHFSNLGITRPPAKGDYSAGVARKYMADLR